MIVSLFKGFDFFKKKMILPAFLMFAVYVIFFFMAGHIFNFFLDVNFSSLDLLSMTSIAPILFLITEALGYKLILLLLLSFFILFINNYIIYAIASIISKKNNLKNVGAILNYTFVLYLVLFCFLLLYSLILLKITTITIILFLILSLLLFVIIYLFIITLFVMATEKDLLLKGGLSKAWLLFKKNFWLITIFLIILFIITEILNFAFLLLVIPFLEIANLSIYLEDGFFFLFYLFVTLYFTTAFTVYINKLLKRK